MTTHKSLFARSLSSVMLLFLACGREQATTPELTLESALTNLAKAGVLDAAATDWGYGEENGPRRWCDLSAAYQLCCEGEAQTPVNITPEAVEFAASLPELEFAYQPTELEAEHNGHTIEAKVPAGEADLVIGAATYHLLQFHFHTKSEHNVLGRALPMEMHLVHRADDATLAVAGVFIIRGRAHPELEKIFGELPQHEGDVLDVHDFDLAKILPRGHATFRYGGSLTTPPCSEGVRWNVMAHPIQMSSGQIDAFQELFSGAEFPHGNRRPVQPLHGRKLLTDLERQAVKNFTQNFTAE